MFTVMQRGRPTSATWAPASGLVDCPEDLRPMAVATVARANAVAGWDRLMIIDRTYDARRPPCDEET